MLTYTKDIKLRIRYYNSGASKKEKNELRIEYVPHDSRIENPMKIFLGDSEITVNAEAMKRACEKVMEIGKI